MPFNNEIRAGASGAQSTEFYNDVVNQSLRFNDDDGANLKRDIASSGNRKTWTWSAWVKRGNLGGSNGQYLFTDGKSSSLSSLNFDSNDKLYVQLRAGGASKYKLTNQVFRDVSSWYHFVWRVDTTQATAEDRSRVYVNGTQITSWSIEQNVNQDTDSTINESGNDHLIGGYSSGTSRNFDGYMAEVNFIDGTSYGPDTFGETKDGVWIPKAVSGVSYGTNGFYLPFGQDTSSGSSFFFNRSSPSQVTFTNSSHYDIGSSDDFTLEAFIRPTSTMMSNYCYLLGHYGGPSGPYMMLQFSPSGNQFNFYYGNGAAYQFDYTSGDIVAGQWHHIAINRNSGNLRFFIDGTQKDSTFTSNTQTWDNSQFDINIAGNDSSYSGSTYSFDGYISNVRLVVGSAVYSDAASLTVPTATLTNVTNTKLLALTTSTFTQDASSNNVTGTVTGSSHFSSDLSPFASFNFFSDTSGNTNNFTANNLFVSDVVPDSPENNFSVMNPIYHSSRQATLSEGNLKVQNTTNFSNAGANGYGAVSTFPIPKDKKVYIEVQCDSHNGYYWYAGFATQSGLEAGVSSTNVGGASSVTFYGRAVMKNGTQFQYSSSSGVGGLGGGTSPFAINDVLGMAVDGSNGNVWFSKNGSYFKTIASNNGSTGNVGDPSAGTDPVATVDNVPDEDLFVVIGTGNPATVFVNFGQDSQNVTTANADANDIGTFEYAPPTDYVSLCASNLTTPDIGPTQSKQADDNFNTVLYAGNGGSSNAISGVGFSPDWLWIKNRTDTYSHMIYDTVRGAGKYISSDNTGAEATGSHMNSFDSDGFTVSVASSNRTNASSNNYVAWNWLAGTAFSNDASATGVGSIDSSGQVNTTAGFSIVSYEGSGSNATIAHGLSSAPEFILVKNRENASGLWLVYHAGIASDAETDYVHLESTNAAADDNSSWNDTAPTSSVFSVGTSVASNQSGNDHIAYCFHSVEGYSKVGSYTGNGNADGPFIHTGFRPAWILIKNITDAGEHWEIWDNTRDTHNVLTKRLRASSNGAEVSSTFMDFVSNGVKHRNTSGGYNASGKTFIYLAFAEQPFKFSNAR